MQSLKNPEFQLFGVSRTLMYLLPGTTSCLPCERRFLSGMTFSIYEVVRVVVGRAVGLLTVDTPVNKLTTWLISDAKNFVNGKTDARKIPVLAGYFLLVKLMILLEDKLSEPLPIG